MVVNNLILVAFFFSPAVLSPAENKVEVTYFFSALGIDMHMEGNASFLIFYRIYYVIFVTVNSPGIHIGYYSGSALYFKYIGTLT